MTSPCAVVVHARPPFAVVLCSTTVYVVLRVCFLSQAIGGSEDVSASLRRGFTEAWVLKWQENDWDVQLLQELYTDLGLGCPRATAESSSECVSQNPEVE